MGQGTLSLSFLVIDEWFTGQASGSPARYRETSVRSGPGWKSPRPLPRRLPLYKVRGLVESAAVALEAAVASAPFLLSLLRLGQRALSFTESPEDFPPGPCEASSSHFCCWRWSSARRPGGQLLQCPQAQAEGLSWPRCTRAAATGLWVSIPRVRSPRSYPQREGTSAGGNLSPQLGI